MAAVQTRDRFVRSHVSEGSGEERRLVESPPCVQHINVAELRNHCRRNGMQIGTIDALLAQLCIRHGLTMLTTDQDFSRIAEHCALKVWSSGA
jgi:hypothetical protein